MAKNVMLDYQEPALRYPKMQTLFKRDKRGKIIIGDYSKEEFLLFNKWLVTEKVDGTNVRIIYRPGRPLPIEIRGRNDRSQMPRQLYDYLTNFFTVDRLEKVFDKDKCEEVVLFGEGYGAGIQGAGKHYQPFQQFILFDINIDGWWIDRRTVEDIADKLSTPIVPIVGLMTTDEVIDFVKGNPSSLIADDSSFVMEGVVCQTCPLVLFRNGDPLKWKLKVKDFLTDDQKRSKPKQAKLK